MTGSGDPVAITHSLTHRYGDVIALNDVSFELRPGIAGLIGVNGAGKSTLMQVLATTLWSAEGSYELCGQWPYRHLSRSRKLLGYMPQSLKVNRSVRVSEFMAYMAWLRSLPSKSARSEIAEALATCDLESKMHSSIGQLSGGMFRRLLLAQALLGDPQLLILDEPTAGLDPEQKLRFRELLTRFGETSAVLVSSHQIEDLAPIADQMVMLDEGSIVFDDSCAAMRALGEQSRGTGSEMSPYEAAFVTLRMRSQGR